MNLHEQCLLRYLQNPDELAYSTEILKLNNFILEKHFILIYMQTTYEEAISQLEEIVRQMETNELDVDQMNERLKTAQ